MSPIGKPAYKQEGENVVVIGPDDVVATFPGDERSAGLYVKILHHWDAIMLALTAAMEADEQDSDKGPAMCVHGRPGGWLCPHCIGNSQDNG